MFFRSMSLLLCLGMPYTLLSAQSLKQDPAAAAALDKARQLSTLQQTSTPSFHIEASFQTFDYKGAPDGDGTVEETSMAGGSWKRTVIFRGKKSEEYFSEGKSRYVSDEGFEGTFVETRILEKLFNPIPAPERFSTDSLSLRKTKFGTTAMDCVVDGLPFKSDSDSKASAPNAAYCVSEDLGILRVVEGHNGLVVVLNNVRRLGNANVAFDIAMSEHGVKRASLHVSKLEGVAAGDVNASVAVSQEHGAAEDVPYQVTAGKKISGSPPVYPKEAKDRRVQGTVVLHCIIGKDGAIRDMEILSTPDDSLVDSAMDAVRTWRYTPYLLNGKPTAVDTNVTVNYAFSR